MAWSAAQDHAGTLYFGCDTVVSFDGDRWRTEGMGPTYLVRGLDVGPNGRIWAAGVNQIGWFDPGARGRPEYHSLIDRLPGASADLGDVWRVYAQGNDSAVFVARGRVLRWDGRAFTSWDYPGMHLVWSTRTAKAVYVHYPPAGLLRIGAAGPAVALGASVIGPSEIRWLDDSREDWLLLTAQGFRRVHGSTCLPCYTEASAFARANTPTSVVRLASGDLAMGTLQGGIAVIDGSGAILRVFNVGSGLPANQVYSLFVDRDGALWAMGPASIVRLAVGSGSSVYSQRGGYPPGGCSSLARSGDSLLAISHSDILRLASDPDSGGAGRFEPLGNRNSRFYCLMTTPAGVVVGHSNGLGLLSDGVVSALVETWEAVFRMNPSLSRPGSILASLHDRILSVDPATGESRVAVDGLPDYGDTVVDEASGRIWIGTPSRGLFVSEGPGKAAAPAGPRYGPLPTEGPALVARAGATVVVLAGGTAFALQPSGGVFQEVAGFPPGSPLAVSNPDSLGGVWAALAPNTGGRTPMLGRIAPDGAGATWTPRSVEGISSIGSMVCLQVDRSPGGDVLWIAGTESLLRAGPAAAAAHPPPRRPVIRAWVRSGGNPGAVAPAGALPYSTQGIHVEFSSLDYGMRESERFQTMLGGAEGQWSPPTDSPERDFSGLREGSYSFRVRLATDSGVAGEYAELRFEIAPPWWRRPVSRAAFASAAALAVLCLLRIRTRALRRRAELLERRVSQRTEELERANAAKSEFVANMSHEIRNPMGGILASAHELSLAPLGPEHRQAVATLQGCATFLASLVEDVLDFASVEAGAYRVAQAPFSPGEVLASVVEMLRSKAGGTRMDVALDPSLPALVVGDAARIRQVLLNFAANAVKFGGGAVRLSAGAKGGQVVFSVEDNGEGIPLDEQRNLFVRFSRLKSARSSAIPGTGLGLAVSRVLAERMGGTVGYSTAPGLGSTFHLRIPLVEGAVAAPGAQGMDARGERALVVEDIAYNARALGAMLTDLGFEVEFAEDGPTALARLSSAPYRAVFLDCDIPGIDGAEVARRFRASEPPGRRTLILATTAHSAATVLERCLASGMDACMTKPITHEKLREALGRRHGAQAGDAAGAGCDPPGLDLRLVLGPAGPSPRERQRELARFVAALDEAVLQVEGSRSLPRAAVSSRAHRVLSLARMVGAGALAGTAADLQEYADAYTDTELAAEIGTLCRKASELRDALSSGTGRDPLNPASAS